MLSIRYKPSMPVSFEVGVIVLAAPRETEFQVFHYVCLNVYCIEFNVCAFEGYFIFKEKLKKGPLVMTPYADNKS